MLNIVTATNHSKTAQTRPPPKHVHHDDHGQFTSFVFTLLKFFTPRN